ncbi:coiled-coil domain-containing protein 12 isoform X3 [Rissa tridactyla]|uniref:coiled-coil domain-containing protein 12 isoform X3 n=1 Tax=Rissa tridactyla TaxID=75485 RepID=UPI0023BAED46|nr:coiled-coil domain-containing protein 12 isoform X3 [Rissa tridactyla]
MAAPGGGLEAEEAAAGPALGRLEEEARRRRERLRALRQRTLQNKDGGERESKQFREDEEEETVKHNPATRYAAWRGDVACGGPLTRSIRLGLSLPRVGLAAMHSCSQTGILNGSATPPGKKKKKIFSPPTDFRAEVCCLFNHR